MLHVRRGLIYGDYPQLVKLMSLSLAPDSASGSGAPAAKSPTSDVPDWGPVKPLNANTVQDFSDKSAKGHVMHCLVIANWCKHCQAYKPEYIECVKRKNNPENYYYIEEKYLNNSYHPSIEDLKRMVVGYPTFFVLKGGVWTSNDKPTLKNSDGKQ